MRRHGADVYRDLKTTFGALVATFGSQTQLARLELTRGEQTDFSRWGSTNDEHLSLVPRFAPLDVVADLESAAGKPMVTAYLARLQNCLLVPLPKGIGGEIETRSARTAEEFGHMLSGIFSAMADGRMREDEAKPILDDIHELMLDLAALAEAVKVKVEADR